MNVTQSSGTFRQFLIFFSTINERGSRKCPSGESNLTQDCLSLSVSLVEAGGVDMFETLHLEFLAKEGGRQFARVDAQD